MKQQICDPIHLAAISRARAVSDKHKTKEILNKNLTRKGFELCLCDFIDATSDIIGAGEIDFFLACSQVDSVIIRDSAVKLLGDSRSLNNEIDAGLGLRLRDSSWIVRCSAMYGLGLRQSKTYTTKIVDRYKSWSFIEKQWVLMSLVKMKDDCAKTFLMKIYRYSTNRDRKYLAAAGLAVIGIREPKDYLDAEYSSMTDPEARYTLEMCKDLMKR